MKSSKTEKFTLELDGKCFVCVILNTGGSWRPCELVETMEIIPDLSGPVLLTQL